MSQIRESMPESKSGNRISTAMEIRDEEGGVEAVRPHDPSEPLDFGNEVLNENYQNYVEVRNKLSAHMAGDEFFKGMFP